MSPVKGHSFVVETLKTQNYDSICLPYWGTSVPYSKACLAVFRLMTKSIQKQYNTIPHKDLNRQCYYVQNTQVPSHQGYTAQFRQESETKKRSRRSTCLPCNSFPVKGQNFVPSICLSMMAVMAGALENAVHTWGIAVNIF